MFWTFGSISMLAANNIKAAEAVDWEQVYIEKLRRLKAGPELGLESGAGPRPRPGQQPGPWPGTEWQSPVNPGKSGLWEGRWTSTGSYVGGG